MIISKSGQLYRERKRRVRTGRGPVSRIATGQNGIHTYPLTPPRPYIPFVQDTNGNPPPDGGLTTPWPHGETLDG